MLETEVVPPAPDSSVNAIRDGWIRALGVPAFGISIPWLANLYGPLTWSDPRWWAGQAAFIALAAVIWEGNRWLLFKQREHLDWFAQPARKLIVLLFAIVCFTAPLTILWIASWFAWADFGSVNWEAVRTVTLANVICVVFVTHAYETVFLIRDRGLDQLRLAQLEQARTQAQLDALRAQIDPHFLFNSLNTLNWLIETDPARARQFNETLARVYRYVLAHREVDLVDMADEFAFADDYVQLMRLRFGEGLQVAGLQAAHENSGARMVPISLQVLLENAIKHNQVGSETPLEIAVEVDETQPPTLAVRNARRPRKSARPSTGVGLANLARRVELATGRALQWTSNGEQFVVRLPLVPAAPELGAMAKGEL